MTDRRSSRRTRWREAVLAHRGKGMNGEVRALLLVLAEQMNANALVAVSRAQLADLFDVPASRITERLQRARDLGLLGVVKEPRKGEPAMYEGIVSPANRVRRHGPQIGSAATDPKSTGLGSVTTDPEKGPSRSTQAIGSAATDPKSGAPHARVRPTRARNYVNPGNQPSLTPASGTHSLGTSDASTSGPAMELLAPEHLTAPRTGPDYEIERRRQLAALEVLIAEDRGSEGDQPQGGTPNGSPA